MIKKGTLAILLLLLVPAVLFSTPNKKSQKYGKLGGKLGFMAMTTDAYYEICFSKGVRTDNHLRGIDKLMKKKWGISFSEVKLYLEERSGRDFREEAHSLVHSIIKKTKGCNTRGMKKWVNRILSMHGKNLDKFHALK
mgnify:CR=1 FL=1